MLYKIHFKEILFNNNYISYCEFINRENKIEILDLIYVQSLKD